MALTMVDIIRIKGVIKKECIDSIYLYSFYENMGKNKYSDSDLLEFFANEVINSLNSSKSVSEKILLKYLYSINLVISYMKDEALPIPSEIITKIHEARNLCEEKNNTGVFAEKDEISDYLKDTNNLLIDHGLAVCSVGEKLKNGIPLEEMFEEDEEEIIDSEKVIELELKILELQQEIDSLTEQLKDAQKQNKVDEKKNKKLNDSLEKVRNELAQSKKDLKNLRDENKKLSKKVDDAQVVSDKIKEQEKIIEELRKEAEILLRRITIKEKEVSEYKEIESKNQYYKQVEKSLMKILSGSPVSFDDIYSILLKEGFSITREELDLILVEFKKRVNIISNKELSFPQLYRISAPQVLTCREFNFNLPSGTTSYDLMIISDLHLYKADKSQMYIMDQVYNYCTRLGIKSIVNLGDFTDYNHYYGSIIEGVCNIEALIERIVQNFPSDRSITQAILGGNHDRNLHPYGIDLLDRLQRERNDFVSLGYDHASISFNNQDKIMLHHMDLKFPETMVGNEYNVEELVNKIRSYYSRVGKNRDDYYIDLLGHFHKSRLDCVNSMGILPSLYKDRECNGAWHLRLYFNNDKSIKHIVVIPLVELDRKLVTSGEVNYQKLVLK